MHESIPSTPDIPHPDEMMLPTESNFSSASSPRPSTERRMTACRGQQAPSPSAGAGYTWILDHILTYPATYEIPLRTMYTLNSAPRAQPLPQSLSRPTSEQSRRSQQSQNSHDDGNNAHHNNNNHHHRQSPKDASRRPSEADDASTPSVPPSPQQEAAQNAATEFKSNLMTQIAHLPSQPCSLPPSFITSFVRRCFPEELGLVDFPQALTGMDYLRDLDIRRRRELVGALRRLGIDRENLGPDGEARTVCGNRAIAEWVRDIDEKEKRVEALYTQVYIGLRRWTIINEMALPPFNKSNCLAMLNTLYPPPNPSQKSQPTRQLTPSILEGQRDGFWRYIQAVERNGPAILDNLMLHGRRVERGDVNGWPSVREVLDKYLRAANGVIEECTQIVGPETFADMIPEAEVQRRNGRKVDSGISFASHDRPSTSQSSIGSRDKPLPSPPPQAKNGSTLEKIARELRKIRDRKRAEETLADDRDKPKAKTLKKMKSTSALGDMRANNKSFANGSAEARCAYPPFSPDEERRRRAILEATTANRTLPKMKYQPLRTQEV